MSAESRSRRRELRSLVRRRCGVSHDVTLANTIERSRHELAVSWSESGLTPGALTHIEVLFDDETCAARLTADTTNGFERARLSWDLLSGASLAQRLRLGDGGEGPVSEREMTWLQGLVLRLRDAGYPFAASDGGPSRGAARDGDPTSVAPLLIYGDSIPQKCTPPQLPDGYAYLVGALCGVETTVLRDADVKETYLLSEDDVRNVPFDGPLSTALYRYDRHDFDFDDVTRLETLWLDADHGILGRYLVGATLREDDALDLEKLTAMLHVPNVPGPSFANARALPGGQSGGATAPFLPLGYRQRCIVLVDQGGLHDGQVFTRLPVPGREGAYLITRDLVRCLGAMKVTQGPESGVSYLVGDIVDR